jgi:hypothetical protein
MLPVLAYALLAILASLACSVAGFQPSRFLHLSAGLVDACHPPHLAPQMFRRLPLLAFAPSTVFTVSLVPANAPYTCLHTPCSLFFLPYPGFFRLAETVLARTPT